MFRFYLPQNYFFRFNAIFLLIQKLTPQIATRNGRNALRTGAGLVAQSVLRQLRGPNLVRPGPFERNWYPPSKSAS